MDDDPWARNLYVVAVVGGITLAWVGAGWVIDLFIIPRFCTAMSCSLPTPADYLVEYLPAIVMVVLGAGLVLGGLLGLRAHPRVPVIPPSGWATPLAPGEKAVRVRLVRRPLWRRLWDLGAPCMIASGIASLLITWPLAHSLGWPPEYQILYDLAVYPPLIGFGVGAVFAGAAAAMKGTEPLRKALRQPDKAR